MGSTIENRSKIYDFDSIEADDELETELTRHYAEHCEVAKNKSEIELHNYLQDKASQNKKEYNQVVSALLYGVLTEPEHARMFFQSISFVNRDNFSLLVGKLHSLTISIKFQKMRLPVREQVLWLISELTKTNVQSVDTLYICLMRQIRGGDTSQSNLLLCDQIIKLCETQRSWLSLNPRIIATTVYTYLRVIADHRSTNLQALQQKEIRFVISLVREKWMLCVPIGRDLIRVLHDLVSIPEFAQLWDDLLNHPQKLSPRFTGVESMLKSPTPKEFLKCRLTPDIEFKLLYILQNLRSNQYQRNLNWFVQRFLNTPESEPFYVDIVRFLVAGWYPSNQILQSDIVPRYVIIGSMIRSIKNKIVLANVKTALIYDWLFFTPTDNIMFIEPAMLLMERSAERYPQITATMMEFLKFSVDRYFPPLKDYMAQCVACGMRVLLNKGVIRSLVPIYHCPSTEPVTRDYMQSLFSEFLVDSNTTAAANTSTTNNITTTATTTTDQIPLTATLPASVPMQSTESIKSQPSTPKSGQYQRDQQHDDEDVDAFLYGNSEEDETMDPTTTASVAAEIKEEPMDELSTVPSSSSVVMGEDRPIPEVKYESDVDEENEPLEEEAGEGLQSHQSYWIFGDSLKRFKDACIATIAAQKEMNQDEYTVQILIAKRSLKEILAVFLRMAIPAETLGSTVGPHVRNMVTSNMLDHHTTATPSLGTTTDEDAIVADASKDVFDLVMATFWNVRDNSASTDKLIRLIGCMVHTKKNKGKRHIIGMRWWSFIAHKIEEDELAIDDSESEDWLPSILKNYKTFVLHAYTIEGSTVDQTEYFKEYLKADLQTLAEQSAVFFNTIIPLLYHHLPNATIGNLDILKLTLLMLLPDTVGKISCSLHYGSIQLFGDKINSLFVSQSLSLATYETICFWQLLAAELQGKVDNINQFLQDPQVIDTLKTNFKNEIVPSLFSILTSVPPSKDIIYTIIRIVPEQRKLMQPQVQFVLASLQYWSAHATNVFLSALSSLVLWMIDEVDAGENQPEAMITLLEVLSIWWNQKSTSESFKQDKNLLSSLAKLGNLVGHVCPKAWIQEPIRNKRKRGTAIFSDSDDD